MGCVSSNQNNLVLDDGTFVGLYKTLPLGKLLYKGKMHILVGFYYNRYNAEKDLPSVLLSDSSLLENVTAEISQEVFRNKAGFRIKIFPLSGGINPMNISIKVLLPQPDLPIMPK